MNLYGDGGDGGIKVTPETKTRRRKNRRQARILVAAAWEEWRERKNKGINDNVLKNTALKFRYPKMEE